MRKFLPFLFPIIISAMVLTSCDLFHITNTTRGNSYALIYGVADYIGEGNDLNYTDDDAEDMKKFFTKHGFDTTLRLNSDATKSAMLADMKNIRENPAVDENSVTVLFFSGHGDGYRREKPTDYRLEEPVISFPSESIYEGQSSLIPYFSSPLSSSKILYNSELLDELSTIPGKKLLILDICFAGGFVPENGVDIDGLPGDYGYTGDPLIFFRTWETYLSKDSNTKYKDIWVIGSAGENEFSYEGASKENGYFTYYLLQSLGYNHTDFSISETVPADANSDGLITVSEMYNETFNRFQYNYNASKPDSYSSMRYYSHTSGGAKDLILLDLSR